MPVSEPSKHMWPGEWMHWKDVVSVNEAEASRAAREALAGIRLLEPEALMFVTPILMETRFDDSGDYGAPAEQLPLLDDLSEWLDIYIFDHLHCISYYVLMPVFLGDWTRRDLWLEKNWDLGFSVKHRLQVPTLERILER